MENASRRHPLPLVNGSADSFGDFHTWPRKENADPTRPKDAVEEFFDMPGYLGTDVINVADVTMSEGSAADADSPPALTTGSSSVAALGDTDDDCVMQDVPPQEPEHPIVWPKVAQNQLPRDQEIHISPYETQDASSSMPIGLGHHAPIAIRYGQSPPSPSSSSSSPSPLPSNAKTRVVKDTEMTHQVRQRGACSHCKISRISCDNNDICCSKCTKMGASLGNVDIAVRICKRRSLLDTLGTYVHRWECTGPMLYLREQQCIPNKAMQKLFVSFSNKPSSPEIEVNVGQFGIPNGSRTDIRVRIWPGMPPSDQDLYTWAKSEKASDLRTDFSACIGKLLQGFVDSKGSWKDARHPNGQKHESAVQKQAGVMAKLLNMACMWRIWASKGFFVREANEEKTHTTNSRYASIQDQLRRHAGQALSTLERDILKGFNEYITLPKMEKDDPTLSVAFHVALWTTMWQIMLLYRDSLRQTNPASLSTGVPRMSDSFQNTTEELYEGITVMYSQLFRTKATIESVRDAGPEVFGNDHSLHAIFKAALRARSEFYDQVSPAEKLLADYLIKRERKKFPDEKAPARK